MSKTLERKQKQKQEKMETSADIGPDQGPSISPKPDKKAAAAPERVKAIWLFPREGRRCPRCRGYNTEAYTTKGNIQYRRCRAAVCRNNYSVRASGRKGEKD